jgi:hypothetical protein
VRRLATAFIRRSLLRREFAEGASKLAHSAAGDEQLSALHPAYGIRLPPMPAPASVLVDGAAHAQFIFVAEQGERLMREIVRFLSEP